MLVFVGACTVFLGALVEQSTERPTQEEQPAREEPTQEEQPVQEQAHTATINVTGDVAFSCSIGSGGSSRTVDGQAPASFETPVDTDASFDLMNAICT